MDLFYDEFIKEAQNGRINCGMYFNIIFNTSVYNNGKLEELTKANSNLLVPTLIIKNKDNFDNLLQQYIYLAKEFYNDKKIDVDNIDKMLMATLFSNMTSNDFNNVENYLKLRINFMKDQTLSSFLTENIFYSDILKQNIIIKLDKNYPYDETPYSLNVILTDGINKCLMPSIRLGIDNDTCYIYAIQNPKQEKTDYSKKINRKLFLVNENFIDESNNDENIKDVTMSFILVTSILFGILDDLKINKIKVSPLLIERWNAKRIMFDIKEEYNKKLNRLSTMKEDIENHDYIQTNLTEKFIRTFRRIMYHFSNIKINSYPYEIDDYLYLINNGDYSCNNNLLDEMYNLGRSKNNEKNENHIRR